MAESRAIGTAYGDPVDQIWVATAQRLGFTVVRSSEVYASTDGCGRIILSTPEHFDADDCLGQMILHELCHYFVQGEPSRALPDWGLRGIDPAPSDVLREHACLRLQRWLLLPRGLEVCFGATTDYRPFYDALGDAPLAAGPGVDPEELALAEAGRVLYEKPPHRHAIDAALRATACIAAAASTLAGPPSSWATWRPSPARPPPRHPFGFAWGPADRTCDTCAWAHAGANGALRCVRTARPRGAGRHIAPAQRACAFFEESLDCATCGACCRQAFDTVLVGPREPAARRHADLLTPDGRGHALRRVGGFCPAVVQTVAERHYRCSIYADRPASCARFERGSANCLLARRRTGVSPP